jgi:hypothetical protein
MKIRLEVLAAKAQTGIQICFKQFRQYCIIEQKWQN